MCTREGELVLAAGLCQHTWMWRKLMTDGWSKLQQPTRAKRNQLTMKADRLVRGQCTCCVSWKLSRGFYWKKIKSKVEFLYSGWVILTLPVSRFTLVRRLLATVSAHASTRAAQLPVLKHHFSLPRVQNLSISAERCLHWTTKSKCKSRDQQKVYTNSDITPTQQTHPD